MTSACMLPPIKFLDLRVSEVRSLQRNPAFTMVTKTLFERLFLMFLCLTVLPSSELDGRRERKAIRRADTMKLLEMVIERARLHLIPVILTETAPLNGFFAKRTETLLPIPTPLDIPRLIQVPARLCPSMRLIEYPRRSFGRFDICINSFSDVRIGIEKAAYGEAAIKQRETRIDGDPSWKTPNSPRIIKVDRETMSLRLLRLLILGRRRFLVASRLFGRRVGLYVRRRRIL